MSETVCTKCIVDKKYVSWIRKNGVAGFCTSNKEHKGKRIVADIIDFAFYLDGEFKKKYQIGEDKLIFDQHGDPDTIPYGDDLNYVLAEELNCEDEKLIQEIINNLPDDHFDPFYEEDKTYELISVASKRKQQEADDYYDYWYHDEIAVSWEDFCNTVKHKRRFFQIEEILDNLFGSRQEFEKGVNKPIYELKKNTEIFRARILDHHLTYKTLNKYAKRELGAPPKEKATAGRMNVGFIPVFYGAFKLETAACEVRPGYQEKVAIAHFTLKRKIKVFDFTVFDEEDKTGENRKHTRYDFIKNIHMRISKPISHFEKDLEYIPTQIVAEYIKTKFGCSAIIYGSSLHNEGKNIVFLDEVSTKSSSLRYSKFEIKVAREIKYTFKGEFEF